MALNLMPLDSNKTVIYNTKSQTVRQGEKGIVLPVVLTSKNIGVKDLANINLNFEATKPDGKIVLDENQDHFTKSDGYFEYTLPAEVYQATGEVKGHFILKYNDNVIDTTSDFSIKVLSRTGQDEKSSDYISAAETIVEESRQKLQQIIDVVTTATDQVDLTKSNLTSDMAKFLSDTKTSVNSNIKTLTDNLNTLKNTFNSNITSAEGVFNSKKSEIDDWFTKSQRDYTSQKQSIDSEWSAKKAEKDSDWLKLKASYDNKITGLTNQYQASVDQQKKQLSDDLATFKSQLKSQLDSTQSTINQLKNSDVPAISKKLDEIRADIERIDLDSVKRKADDAYAMAQSASDSVSGKADKGELNALSGKVDGKASQNDLNNLSGRVTTAESDIRGLKNSKPDLSGYYQKAEVDNKDLAFKNMAVAEAKTYTDSKSSLEILTEDQAQKMSDSKTAKLGTFYAMNSGGIQGLALGDVDGSFSTVMGYMVALPDGTMLFENGEKKYSTNIDQTLKLSNNLTYLKNGVELSMQFYSYGYGFQTSSFGSSTRPGVEITKNESEKSVVIRVPKKECFEENTVTLQYRYPRDGQFKYYNTTIPQDVNITFDTANRILISGNGAGTSSNYMQILKITTY
ncbi:BppU family phage baseplate upper protein [Holzapfeliella sp. He02]|uniref:BppU family phage baseplate upper protein n=1 Tax=Holzapfeliella saturejae TaxID=3082953 RepID=A0ABU8SI02_9LACO